MGRNGAHSHSDGAETAAEAAFVTGIASSAGGLEALGPLVARLSPAAAMSYVIVQHLAPQHRSMMAELLARETSLRVEEIADGVAPTAGVIHITPPNHDVELVGGVLRLQVPSQAAGPKPSADRFFDSLAALGPRAVGVVMSGTGSDGAEGLRAIKAAGGVALVQDPKTARYDGMPRSAAGTGVADAILAPAQLGEKLTAYADGGERDLLFPPPVPATDDAFAEVLSQVEKATGVDFAGYKETTLRRRLERRALASGVSDTAAYLDVLGNDPEEARRFVQDALISVTAFFRDREMFDFLPQSLADIVERKRDGQSVRIWVTGCATGEEAYSLGMLALDAARKAGRRLHVQVFATDIDDRALVQARQGAYPESALELVPPALRDQYFLPQAGRFVVSKELRDAVVFARHDLTRDTPFVRMDLVSCRNVLIYFGPDLQREVLQSLHFSLQNDGVLVLGRSENPGPISRLFAPLAGELKIFRRLVAPRGEAVRPTPLRRVAAPRQKAVREPESQIRQALMQHLRPRAMLVDARGDVRETEGDLTGLVTLAPGRAQLNAGRLLIPELRGELSSLLMRARRDGEEVAGLVKETAQGRFRLRVLPAGEDEAGMALFLVLFEPANADTAMPVSQGASDRLPELEQELAATKEHLQSVIEELEASNEELQALNEELQAANEELQATSEEMETSNEELQATNEELTTLNEELRTRTAELQHLNDTLENLQTSIGYALVIVDKRLRIRRFSPDITRYFGISPADVGEPLTGATMHLDIPGLHDRLLEAVQKGASHAMDVETERASLAVRIRPFIIGKGGVDGAVVVIQDETAYRQAQRRLAASEERFNLAVQGASDGIWDQPDVAASAGYWSPRMREMLGLRGDETETSLQALESRLHPGDRSDFRRQMDNHLGRRIPFNLECRLRIGPIEGERATYGWFHLRGQAVWNSFGQPVRMAGALSDVTQRRLAEIRIHTLYEQLLRAEELAGVGHWRLDMGAGGHLYWSDELYRIHGTPLGVQPTLASMLHLIHPDDREAVRAGIERLRETGASFRYEARILRDSGERTVEAVVEAERDPSGDIRALFATIRDVTSDRARERELRGQAVDLGRLVDERAAELEQRVRERELLLKELQHRVKNNLQTIVSLISVQRTAYPAASEVLEALAQRVQTIAFVYDLMLKRHDSDTADLVVVARQICAAAQASAPPGVTVALASDVVTCLVGAEQAVKVAMAIQELVANALKYAFPQGQGQVSVGLGQAGQEWRIIVEDDGIGLMDIDPPTTGGLGLRLVRWLVHGIGGRVERAPSSGARFDIVFPVRGATEDGAVPPAIAVPSTTDPRQFPLAGPAARDGLRPAAGAE